MADAETKFLQLDRVETDTFSKAKPKMPGKTGSLLDKAMKTAANGTSTPHVRGDEKMVYETSPPHPRGEKDPSLKLPPIILPPSFKRKASAQAQPAVTRSSSFPREEGRRSHASISNGVVRKASAPVRQEVNETAQQAQPAVTRSSSFPREEGRRSHDTISNGVVRETQARDNHIDNKGFAKPKIRVSSNISGQARQEKSGKIKKEPPLLFGRFAIYLIASESVFLFFFLLFQSSMDMMS